MPDADVAVAGGGPAGLQFARAVAERSDRSVAVLEANDALADNDKSTGGTFGDLIERYDVPADVVMADTSGVTFEAPGASETLPITGYVLDFPAFLEWLGREAEAAGAEVRTGARVLEPVVEDGRVAGVRYRRSGTERRLNAEVVVDATGPAGTLASQLGVFDPDSVPLAVGKEYEVAGEHDVDSLLFRFDHDDAPGGYAWTFPAGGSVYKAGVCWFTEKFAARTDGDDRCIDDYVRRWIDRDDRWTDGEVRAVHAGKAGIAGSVERRVADGFLAVGDAVSSINPVFGEGIRPGMRSADMAAEVVVDALDAGDVSRERLSAYERRWAGERGGDWRLQRLVGDLLYDLDADRQRRFVENTGRLSPAQRDRFRRYEPTVRDLVELYPFAARDAAKLPSLLRHLRETVAARLR